MEGEIPESAGGRNAYLWDSRPKIDPGCVLLDPTQRWSPPGGLSDELHETLLR